MQLGSGGRDFAAQRARMVERQLRRRGIADERVLAAMAEVPRERFVPRTHLRRAYADQALPIGEEQTISQPWIVAAICEALGLDGSEVLLEIGTGSGYSTAVLAELAGWVISVERVASLAEGARERLDELGAANVEVLTGDGSSGIAARGPFDAIAVHATAPRAPLALLEQLGARGRLVVPIAARTADLLTVFERLGSSAEPARQGDFTQRVIGPCRFVPLIGAEGFPE